MCVGMSKTLLRLPLTQRALPTNRTMLEVAKCVLHIKRRGSLVRRQGLCLTATRRCQPTPA